MKDEGVGWKTTLQKENLASHLQPSWEIPTLKLVDGWGQEKVFAIIWKTKWQNILLFWNRRIVVISKRWKISFKNVSQILLNFDKKKLVLGYFLIKYSIFGSNKDHFCEKHWKTFANESFHISVMIFFFIFQNGRKLCQFIFHMIEKTS